MIVAVGSVVSDVVGPTESSLDVEGEGVATFADFFELLFFDFDAFELLLEDGLLSFGGLGRFFGLDFFIFPLPSFLLTS